MTTQERLNLSITYYGVSDIRTLKLSQERDKEIVAEQRALMERKLKCMG